MKTKIWLLLAGAIFVLAPHQVEASGACTAARFHDWNDMGCNQNFSSAGTPAKSGCPPCNGMPRWWISEPYENLCLKDTPLSYTMSSGKEMDFTFYYRTRATQPESDEVTALPTKSPYDIYPTVINCGTNASWGNNWNLSITIWDPTWESSWVSGVGNTIHPAYAPYTRGYQVFVWRPEGGINYFNVATGQQNIYDPKSLMRLTSVTSGQNYPVVAARVSTSQVNNPPTPDANGIYWGNSGVGLTLVYPDGSQDVFGLTPFPITDYSLPNYDSTAGTSDSRLLLTQHIDPQGRVTQLGYDYVQSTSPYGAYYFRLHYVVDPDGRTNTFNYNSGLQVSEIDDPYGRKASIGYDSSGRINSLTDAATNSSSFAYLGNNGWIDQLTTPYGNTKFCYYQVTESDVTDGYQQRAIYVQEPEGAQQLYFYDHNNPNEAATDTAPTVPGQTFDDGNSGSYDPSLIHRNSYHWGRLQFEALSGNYYLNEGLSEAMSYQTSNPGFSQSEFASALGALSQNDFNKAGLKHWLLSSVDNVSITESLSSERDPSPDTAGSIPGLRTWYNYSGKPSGEPEEIGSDPKITCIARVLSDGTSQYTTYNYYAVSGIPGFPAGAGFVSDNDSSYSKPDGTTGVLTNWFNYAANSVDLISTSNSIGQYVNAGYNGNHEITSITNALNQVTTLNWDSSAFNLKGVQWPGGKSYTLNYYSPATPPTSTSSLLEELSVSPEGRTFTFNNYQAGNPSSVTDDRGVTVNNTWDGLNRLTTASFPDNTSISNVYYRLDLVGTKDRMGNWTRFGFDGLDHLTTITNANNGVWQLDWCSCGSLMGILDPLNRLTSWNYDNADDVTNITFSDFSTLNFQYNLLHQATNIFDGAGRSIQAFYNNQGLPTKVTNVYGTLWSTIYDALNRPMSVTDANGVTVTNTFDAINELLKRIWPDGISESFGWSTAGLIAYTNRDGQFTHLGLDGAGRVTSVTNANLEVVRAGYDSLDHVISLTDGLNHTRYWQYNEYGWLTNKLDGLSRTVFRLAYNADGWATNLWTPEKGNIFYGRDNVGNVTNLVTSQFTNSYAYDADNELTNMLDAIGRTAFAWSGLGQMTNEGGPWANDSVGSVYSQGMRTALTIGSTWSQSYSYDSAWRMMNTVSPAGTFNYSYNFSAASPLVTAIGLPNGANIVNSFDTLGRIKETDLNNYWGHTLDGYSYELDPLGLRTNIVRNLGLTSSSVAVGYDKLAQITSWLATETNGTPRMNEQLGFGYDSADNLHSRTNNLLVQTFNTDAADELTSVTRSGTFTLSGATPAPAIGVTVNGLSAQTYGDFAFAATNLTLANGNNTFTNIAQNVYGLKVTNSFTVNLPVTVTPLYDSNGNLTNDGLRSLTYDAENELTNIMIPGAWKTEFVYDGLNRRRIERDYSWNGSSWAKTNEMDFIYDGYLLVQERDTNGNVLVTYTRGLDLSGSIQDAGGIGGLLARTDPNGSTFYHANQMGNVTALMDNYQNIVGRYLYSPAGRLLGMWGPMAPANEMRFSSMPDYHGIAGYPFRFYFTDLQRWSNQDPIQERGGINLYRFANNDPINKIDPLGLQIPPELIEEVSQLADEYGPEIEADIEEASEATEAEAETLWSKTADYFSKAKQTQLNQGLGRSAENATCSLKNTMRIPSLNNTANYRIPDLLDSANKIIGDTKNVQYLSMSPQLQDFIDWAAANGYTFQLTVSTSTTLSSSVINAVPNIVRAPLP
jgi:RHS repeat-associated protein